MTNHKNNTDQFESAPTDRLGKKIDREIKLAVTGLQNQGFMTVNSCGGHVDRKTSGPYIDIPILDESSNLPNDMDEAILKNDGAKMAHIQELIVARRISLELRLTKTLIDFYAQHAANYSVTIVLDMSSPFELRIRTTGNPWADSDITTAERKSWIDLAHQEFDDFGIYLNSL